MTSAPSLIRIEIRPWISDFFVFARYTTELVARFLTSAIYINLVIRYATRSLYIRSGTLSTNTEISVYRSLFHPLWTFPECRAGRHFDYLYSYLFNCLDIVYWADSVESFRLYSAPDILGTKRRLTEWPIMALVGILD